MGTLLEITGTITSFISSCFAIFITTRLLEVLPAGKEYFGETPVQGITYGELFATIFIILILGYAIGLLHGIVCGDRILPVIYFSASAPLFLSMLGIAAVTLGMGMIAFPLVLAYGVVVGYGARQGGSFRNRLKHRGKTC
jgi:hypothetical protein